MTKDYSREMDGIREQMANSQEKLFQLLDKVTKERNTLDMEKNSLERKLLTLKRELQETIRRKNELESLYADLRGRTHAFDRIVRIGNDMMEQDSQQEKARLNRSINSLKKKLDEETVELKVITEKIQARAKTHGIGAAASMFDTISLLLGDVTAWQKNKGGLERFFADFNEKMRNADTGGTQNNFNIDKVDQMSIGDGATLNH